VLLDITVGTVKHTMFFGISMVLVLLYIFLGNFRAAAVVAAVFPLALCFSFIMMYLFNVPANLISLGAIDFGVTVDAAVIITENVMRHLEEGGKRLNQSIILNRYFFPSNPLSSNHSSNSPGEEMADGTAILRERLSGVFISKDCSDFVPFVSKTSLYLPALM
jgi:hypothetical protein